MAARFATSDAILFFSFSNVSAPIDTKRVRPSDPYLTRRLVRGLDGNCNCGSDGSQIM
jgi:hypothetical protein